MQQDPIAVGSQRQLFLDDLFFASRNNVSLTMHTPLLQEVALVRDRPWESRSLDCPSVLKDGGRYRLWYRADEGERGTQGEDRANVCYAESSDGIHWDKPSLGLVEWGGARETTTSSSRLRGSTEHGSRTPRSSSIRTPLTTSATR